MILKWELERRQRLTKMVGEKLLKTSSEVLKQGTYFYSNCNKLLLLIFIDNGNTWTVQNISKNYFL